MMGRATFKLLANLAAPGEVTYEEIYKVLKEHYKPKPIKNAEQFHFCEHNSTFHRISIWQTNLKLVPFSMMLCVTDLSVESVSHL